MNRFDIGRRYCVLHLDDRRERVTVAARSASTVTLADGRTVRVLSGVAPDGTAEEGFRLNEVGPVATGGVVRACHRVQESGE